MLFRLFLADTASLELNSGVGVKKFAVARNGESGAIFQNFPEMWHFVANCLVAKIGTSCRKILRHSDKRPPLLKEIVLIQCTESQIRSDSLNFTLMLNDC